MAIKHIMSFKYIGSDVVSWATVEEGINYFVNAVRLNGTSDEYTAILRRANETQFLNCTDELINDKSIKRVIEYEDDDARISAHASLSTTPPRLFSSLFKKCDIKFFESFIDTEATTIIEAEITCNGQAEGRPDAKLPWETPEEAKDYIINIINTYASDTNNTYVKDIVFPILDDSERTTLELLDITDYPESGPGPTSAPRPDGFSEDVWNYIYTGETQVFENEDDKTAFSLKVAEELTKFNMDSNPDPTDSIGPNSSLTGSNKLKVSIKFSSQEEHDTYIQQYSWDALGEIEIMLNDLGIEIKIL
tara:strand:- start:164 stop:1081 length:918 start_codon:yes stop_codon:yes gene_type:complete